MVKKIIQQNECISQLSLINSKMSYLMKKLLGTKWKELKVKSINQELMKLTDYLCHVLTIKDTSYVLDDGIGTLDYFHKGSVTSWNEIEKDCDEKDFDKK